MIVHKIKQINKIKLKLNVNLNKENNGMINQILLKRNLLNQSKV
jgi:hypothetical protein